MAQKAMRYSHIILVKYLSGPSGPGSYDSSYAFQMIDTAYHSPTVHNSSQQPPRPKPSPTIRASGKENEKEATQEPLIEGSKK
jgi:hypothetical protein